MSTFWNGLTDAFWNSLYQAQQAASQFSQQATYAKQFYAQQANAAFQSGSGNNWLAASAWDAVGGFVQMGTGGDAQSPGQALFSVVWSVPAVGEGLASKVISSFQTGLGFTSAVSGSLSSVGSATPMTFSDWMSGMAGQLGTALGVKGAAYSELGSALTDIATNLRGTAQAALATAAQKYTSIGDIFNAAANTLSIGGFLYGGKQALGALPPDVGGVLFDQCDTVLTGIEDIAGAYWDEASQSVVLIGKPDGAGNRQRLQIPGLDGDHLKVALRAAIAGLPLGVSIDPPANYRYGTDSHEMMPDGSPLVVSYLGETAGTLYGAIMFESDRIMKCLSVGVENRTRQPFGSHVKGYRDLFGECGNSGVGRSWHRFWFVIDHARLLKSEHHDGVIVDDVGVKVLTELELPHSPKGQAIDPDDRAFAEHLTNNYDAYAKEFPVLARLKELAKISAIARFLVARNVPLDLGALFEEPPTSVATPETTPSILRTASTDNHTRQMSGGVDLDGDPEIVPDEGGKAERIIKAASCARKPAAAVWQVPASEKTLQARSIPLAPYAFRRIVTDHRFADSQPSLELQRIYDSGRGRAGDFGPGWNVFLPYSMIAIRRGGKKAEVLSEEEKDTSGALPSLLIMRDNATGVSELYRPTTSREEPPTAYGRVMSQTVTKGSISFKYDANDVITVKGAGLHLLRQGTDHVFDLDGHLVEVRKGDHSVLKLTYDKCRLAGLTNEAGQGYAFVRGPEGSGAVTRVETRGSGGEGRVTFAYNETGRLKQVGGSSLAKQCYCYGLNGELAEIRDSGRNSCETVSGRSAGTADDVVQLALGASMRRKWEGGRLTSIEDDKGGKADIVYSGNVLKQISIRGRDGTIRKFDFDTDGYLRFTRGSTQSVTAQPAPVESVRPAPSATDKRKASAKVKASLNPVTIAAGSADSIVVEFA